MQETLVLDVPDLNWKTHVWDILVQLQNKNGTVLFCVLTKWGYFDLGRSGPGQEKLRTSASKWRQGREGEGKKGRMVLWRLGCADELCHAGAFIVSVVAEARKDVGKMKGKWAIEILPCQNISRISDAGWGEEEREEDQEEGYLMGYCISYWDLLREWGRRGDAC